VKTKDEVGLRDIAGYFLRLGALGFGGPIALAGYMQRDLVAIFAVAFVILWRFKISEPLLVGASALAGLALFALR
jgi:chromate transport protein ChrA